MQAMKTGEMLRQAAAQLQQAGCDSPRLDAELLLMHVLHISRTDLIIRANEAVPDLAGKNYAGLIERRAAREPLAYILSYKEFWSRNFEVSQDVLIPRPETEHLIEVVLERFPDKNGRYHFCDIGTGSGCIAITLACEYPNAHVIATDISDAALQIADKNALSHQADGRITFRHGDMLLALQQNDGPFDAIISNPPYVAGFEMDKLEAELTHEPREALTDEQDGLFYLNTLLEDGPKHLLPGGYIILETGLCGLPETPLNLRCEQRFHDLANHLRGAVFCNVNRDNQPPD